MKSVRQCGSSRSIFPSLRQEQNIQRATLSPYSSSLPQQDSAAQPYPPYKIPCILAPFFGVRRLVVAFESPTMKLYVGITDYDWFQLHASKPFVEEVNFWRPSSTQRFKVLNWGEPFLFKLHSPRNFIVGGGFFTKFIRLPVSLAWDTFGEANGARSLEEVKVRIGKYRKQRIGYKEDPDIGCILLEEPFFFEERDWIPSPGDFKGPTQTGKSYDMSSGTGLMLLEGSDCAPARGRSENNWSGNNRCGRKRSLWKTTNSNASSRTGFLQNINCRRV